ncbi:MAG: bifunctional riboflavin kinase/FAD synthetase [Desulfovibrionales bacterium]
MQTIRSLQEFTPPQAGTCVTIGNFDGVHRGHQKLIQRVREKSRSKGLVSTIVTFDPHPLRVLLNRKTPPFITLTEQKLELIAGMGIDLTLCLPFTRDLAALQPEDFVRTYLLDGLNMKELVVGYDYAFGKNRKGNFQVLKELGERYGYRTEQVDPVLVDGAIVSSTRIRDMVEAGMVWEVYPLLGRYYRVSGQVIHGRDRGGKLLGFPTANLQLVDELFPKPGVYAVWTEVEGKIHPAVANIGYNPTFGNEVISVEVHILEFQSMIYEQTINIHFVQRLRDEKKFSGLDELIAQIRKDIQLARTILDSSEARIA